MKKQIFCAMLLFSALMAGCGNFNVPYSADCTCLVERMSSTVNGLEEDKYFN